MQLAAIGMLVAVIGTLMDHDIVDSPGSSLGLVVGSGIGAAISIWMPMTAIPQRTAISHAFGALAATLVGIAHYDYITRIRPANRSQVEMAALGFEVMFGSLTITGSLMAFGKLQGFCPAPRSPTSSRTSRTSACSSWPCCCSSTWSSCPSDRASHALVFYLMVLVGLAVGVLIVMPIGGADMPVVISLLNSYAGLASSATGFALGNNVLIIAGALDGASGLLALDPDEQGHEPLVRQRAVRRLRRRPATAGARPNRCTGKTVRSISVEDAAVQLAYARR